MRLLNATKCVHAVYKMQMRIITNSDHLSMFANLWIRVRVSGQMAATLGSQSVSLSRNKEGTYIFFFLKNARGTSKIESYLKGSDMCQ